LAQPEGIPFGNYRLLKRLARGGMAEVFLARQGGLEGFHRVVAVKRILPHLVDSQEFVRMFGNEARLAARLTHPNIVHIYEFGKVDEHFFIAMEFVGGVHAGQVIKHGRQGEPIPFELVARVGADACAGLRYAHGLTDDNGRSLNLVHRDISPPNLMFTFDGIVKLVDFGIAKAVTSSEHTRPGVIKGKFAYMSPEQCTARHLTGKSDVFSLAIVLWELLASKVAVSREDPVAGMKKIRDGKLEPIEKARPDVPPLLAFALSRALEVDPQRRANAAELATLFEEYLKQSPHMVTSQELGQWLRDRFPRLHTTGSMKALSGTEAVGPGTVAATAQATAASALMSAQSPAPQPTVPGFGARGLADEDEPPTEVVQLPPSFASGEFLSSARIRPHRRRNRRALIIAAFAVAAVIAGVIGLGDSGDGATAPAPDDEMDARPPVAVTPVPAAHDAAPAVTVLPPDAAPVYAELEVITRPPGATVGLDGEAHTEISPVRFRELSAGEHTIKIELADHEPLSRSLSLAAGERRTLELPLTAKAKPPPIKKIKRRPPRFGRLTARTKPWSHVYLKGKRIGTTPFANIKLPAGTHTLTFKNPKRGRKRQRVTIKPGKTTKLNLTL
jgi:serine/threonine-protein kinase